MTRIAPAWLSDPGTRAVMDALATRGGDDCARFVGGCVRDALLGREALDVDVATRLHPAQVVEALSAAGLKAVPTGIDHGTVTAVSRGRPVEITTLRRDVATDGRRAVVAFTDDWAEDAARRDFHLNALYAEASGKVFDPTGRGIDDVLAGRVVFVGDPDRRIAEDHLRILRFFRFFAWFGRGEPHAAGLAACAASAEGVDRLSAERLSAEMIKLLSAPDPAAALRAMAGAGVLERVLGRPGDVDRLALVAPRSDDPLVRLSALWPDDPDFVAAAARRLRLPRAAWARLEAAAVLLALEGEVDRAARRLIYEVGAETARDQALKSPDRAASEAVLAMAARWTPPRLPVGGRDVARLGIPTGPQTGAVLKAFESEWVADDFPTEGVAERLSAAVSRVRGSEP